MPRVARRERPYGPADAHRRSFFSPFFCGGAAGAAGASARGVQSATSTECAKSCRESACASPGRAPCPHRPPAGRGSRMLSAGRQCTWPGRARRASERVAWAAESPACAIGRAAPRSRPPALPSGARGAHLLQPRAQSASRKRRPSRRVVLRGASPCPRGLANGCGARAAVQALARPLLPPSLSWADGEAGRGAQRSAAGASHAPAPNSVSSAAASSSSSHARASSAAAAAPFCWHDASDIAAERAEG